MISRPAKTYPFPILRDEVERLEALRGLGILDTPPEKDFEAIVNLIAAVCETPVALVSLVDTDRQWFKARLGFCDPETSRDVSFCAHAIANPDDLLVVPDTAEDPRFSDNALVTGEPFVRFYAGSPLVTADGRAIGTVCVLDTVPRMLSLEQREALRLVSRVAVILMERRQTIEALHVLREEHERANERLKFLASHDGLTSLPNRSHFLHLVQNELASGLEFGIAFVDVDRFKEINDTFGHAAGDQVLSDIAMRIRDAVRPEDVVARLGGDEFTICFRGITSDRALTTAAQRISGALAPPYRIAGTEREIGASIGLVRPRAGATVATLLHDADAAMYVAKSRALGSIHLFEPEARMR